MRKITNRFLIIIIVFIISAFSSNAQIVNQGNHATYNLAAGIRLGTTPGFSLKVFTSESSAVEVLLHTRYRGWLVTGLYEKHKQAFDEPRLHWFYGLGGHAGVYSGQYFFDDNSRYLNGSEFNLGIDGILGLEYHIEEIPFTVGIDVKPYIDVLSRIWPYMDGALTIRYVIN